MSEEIAERALTIALESPAPRIKIEFQGGEPLLNFPLIAKIVQAAKIEGPKKGKQVDFACRRGDRIGALSLLVA